MSSYDNEENNEMSKVSDYDVHKREHFIKFVAILN